MTAQCPICRTQVEVDDAKLGADGTKVQCALCEEVFVVRAQSAAAPAPSPASSSGKTSQTRTPSQPASASRRILEEDAEGAAPRVLVAHDSHAFADTVKALLEEEGFDVELVHDGDAAAKRMTEQPPLVAILEAGLPRKFGFQLCAEMRAVPEAAGVKFLLVASIYDRKRFASQPELATAPDDFLEPRNLELELLPKVRRLLRGRPENTASRPAATGARRVDASGPEDELEALSKPAAAAAEAPARGEEDRPSTSRPTVDQDDFKELFEDSAFQNTGSRSSAGGSAPASGAADADVDALLASDGGAKPASAPSLDDDEDDLLKSVLEDSDASPPARAKPEPETGLEESPSLDEERAEGTGSGDGDELLRTLMKMASSEGVEPSKPSLEDDEVLPDGDEDAAPPRRSAPADEDELLGGILEDAPPPKAASAFEEDELSSKSGDVPSSWEPDSQERKIPPASDEALDELLGGGTQDEEIPASKKDDAAPASAAAADEVVRISEFELDAPPAAAKKEEPKAEKKPSFDDDVISVSDFEKPAAEEKKAPASSGGFELEGDGDLRAALEKDQPFESGGPSRSGGITPTVIKKNGAGGPMPASAESERGSMSATESVLADDDEKSLAEARSAPREMDDELDRLLTGGGSGGSREPDPEFSSAPRAAPAAAAAPGSASEHEKARRLAKLIVGDILLYNAERIADAVKSGTFFEVMKGDIKDGRDFYDEKVPEDVRREHDYIQEVLEEVLAKKRKELGLA